MICNCCNQDKPDYHFFVFRGNYNVAKASFFVRPVYELDGLCFDCAAPYRCVECGEIQDASAFRVQGRVCVSCKTDTEALFAARRGVFQSLKV